MPYIIDPKTGKKIEIDAITGQPKQAPMEMSSPSNFAQKTDREKRIYKSPETGIKPLDALARFGENAQYDMGEIWQGLKALPGYAKQQVREKGVVGGIAQVGKDMVSGTIDEYANLIKDPKKQLTERPMSTFLDLLPFAQMAKASAVSKASKAAKAGEVATKATKAGKTVTFQPFKKAFKPEISEKAASIGIDELPISAQTNSRLLKGGEAITKKGFFGSKITDVEDAAMTQIGVARDNLIKGIDSASDPKSVGLAIQKGFDDFENTFDAKKNVLYDKARTPALDTAVVDLEKTRAALTEIIDQKSMSAAPDPSISFYKEILDNLNAKENITPSKVEIGVTSFRGTPQPFVADVASYFDTPRGKGFQNSLNNSVDNYNLKNPVVTKGAGVWNGGIEPSYPTEVVGRYDDAVRYGVDHALKTNQDAVVFFKAGSGGGVKYEFNVSNADDAIKLMREQGLEYATVKGNKLIILDADGSLKSGIMSLGEKLNAKPTTTTGKVELIFKDAYSTYATGAGNGGDLLLPDLQKAGAEAGAATTTGLTYDVLKQTRTSVGKKLKNRLDPISTGDKASLERLYAAMSGDLDNTVKAADPNTFKLIEKANDYYRDTINKINSSVGKKIANSDPEKLVDDLVKPNSETQVTLVKEIVGKEGTAKLQKAFVEKIVGDSLDKNGQLDLYKFTRNIEKYGESTIGALLDEKQFSKLKQIRLEAKVIQDVLDAVKTGIKPGEGSQTAMLQRIGAMGGLLAVNPGIAFKVLMGDLAVSKLFTSKFGKNLFTKGVEVTAPNMSKVAGSTKMMTPAVPIASRVAQPSTTSFSSGEPIFKGLKQDLVGEMQEQSGADMGFEETITIKNQKTGETRQVKKSQLSQYGLGESEPGTFGGMDKQSILMQMAQQGNNLKQLKAAKDYLDILMPDEKVKDLTATQIRDVNLANNGLRAMKVVIDEITDDDGNINTGRVNEMRLSPKGIGYKKLKNAVFDVTGARLRIESGAAINAEEIRRYADEYFLQLLDSPDSIQYELQQMYLFLNDTKNQKPAAAEYAMPTFSTGEGISF